MPTPAGPLLPVPGERGLASYETPVLAGHVLAAWDGFLALARALADDGALDRPSRLPGWSARDVCVHLGSWPDAPTLVRLLDEARAAAADPAVVEQGAAFDQEAHNEALLAAHRGAPDDEVLAALAAGRGATAGLLEDPELDALALVPTRSLLGPLPLLGHVAAAAYELAVHAGDLAPAGAPEPARDLLHAGVGALVDVTGALCARAGTALTAAVLTPTGGWAFGARGADWTTVELARGARAGDLGWPAIEAEAAVVLDVSAGRVAAPPLLVRRELRTHDVAGLLELAGVVQDVPGLPGGAAVLTATRYLSGVGRLVRRLPGLG
ncbi:maleylpyruvate isomerase N-terminal domain-containing protein [Vallicoccus soli]|uniref:maleylpyruvate isomerase N-terminal domain-containing protein n=1 Tax=Vallicoccus soli TaxID=2339232 RepID=UPI001C49AB39|nr:maleylpyruvate isomerase N-terminal domain-containing protein [Vallicoccus soli]